MEVLQTIEDTSQERVGTRNKARDLLKKMEKLGNGLLTKIWSKIL